MNRKLFASLCRINRGSGETSFVEFFVFNFHIIFPFLAKRIQSNASLVNIQEKYSWAAKQNLRTAAGIQWVQLCWNEAGTKEELIMV